MDSNCSEPFQASLSSVNGNKRYNANNDSKSSYILQKDTNHESESSKTSSNVITSKSALSDFGDKKIYGKIIKGDTNKYRLHK